MGKALAGAVLALVVAVASCATAEPPSSSRGGATPWRPTASASVTTPAGMTLGRATSPVEPSGSHVVAIGGQVFGGDENAMDQLWWNFTGGTPRCVAEYVTPPVTDEQTGAVVDVAGDAFVRLQCSPVHALQLVTADPEEEPFQLPKQLGRYRISELSDHGARNIVDVVQTGWGGGALTVTVGLRHRAPMGIAWVGGDGDAADAGAVQGAWLVVMQ